MARDFYVNGECLVLVKGRTDSSISSLSQLGLAADPVRVTPVFRHQDINVDAWGQAPADVQWMLAEMMVSMTMIHFDRTVLNTCIALSMGGGQPAVGQMARAGTRLGGGVTRFMPGNNYIGLQLTSPVGGIPWQFFFTYLMDPPVEFPLGTEKSLLPLRWRVIPYPLPSTSLPAGSDPYGNGLGATNYPLWSHTVLDT